MCFIYTHSLKSVPLQIRPPLTDEEAELDFEMNVVQKKRPSVWSRKAKILFYMDLYSLGNRIKAVRLSNWAQDMLVGLLHEDVWADFLRRVNCGGRIFRNPFPVWTQS